MGFESGIGEMMVEHLPRRDVIVSFTGIVAAINNSVLLVALNSVSVDSHSASESS